MLNFDFLSPAHISFGWGRFGEAGSLAARVGRRALIVVGSKTLESKGVVSELESTFSKAGVEPIRLTSISQEPEVRDVDAAVARLLDIGVKDGDLVIGIGGGSAIDLAKAVSALATNRHGDSVQDFLEGVGRGLAINRNPLPLMAIPTTAGTGTEATKNAVISSYSPAFKKSLRSERMIPRIVLIDPQLSVSVPPTTTAYTGMDAITQLIESYISCRARPIPKALCLQGLQHALPAIATAVQDGSDRLARESMAHAALLSGMALANSGLGMAHGVAAALGVHCRVPHGLACAVMLPPTLRANYECRQTELESLSQCLPQDQWTRANGTTATEFIDVITELCHSIGIPGRLADLGVAEPLIPDIVQSSRGNSMSGNPREVDDEELAGILSEML